MSYDMLIYLYGILLLFLTILQDCHLLTISTICYLFISNDLMSTTFALLNIIRRNSLLVICIQGSVL